MVAEIIADVRARGDAAVIELTARFDRLDADARDPGAFTATRSMRPVPQVAQAEDRAALELAAERIRAYHARQMPADESWTDAAGATLGWRWTPVSAAGLYVPGGLASYPSSVLMNAIPAKVAGVERLAICAPTPDGVVNPLVLLAAQICRASTRSTASAARRRLRRWPTAPKPSRPVDKITGPGNAFVAAAKRRVFGKVGIDMIAGPSEILVIADGDNDPDWIALDLLSQAEHDESAQSILITDDAAFGAGGCATPSTSGWKRWSAAPSPGPAGAISARSSRCAIWTRPRALSDRIAPEHLELCVADPEALAAKITPRRRDLSGPVDARGDRRLCRRAEPCAADGALGAVLLRPVGDGFPEAHDAGADDARGPARHRPGGRDACAVGSLEAHGLSRARPARPVERGGRRDEQAICHIEIDDSGLPPPTPEIEQERKVAIFDLLEDNTFAPARARWPRGARWALSPEPLDPRPAAGLRCPDRGRRPRRPNFTCRWGRSGRW